jgi:hypothetical protein
MKLLIKNGRVIDPATGLDTVAIGHCRGPN